MSLSNSPKIGVLQTIARVFLICLVLHGAYILLWTLVLKMTAGLEALIFVPLIFMTIIGLFIGLAQKFARLGLKTILFSLIVSWVVWNIVSSIWHPELFSGDGSTLVSANIFVPQLIWDESIERLWIYPATYLVSMLFNYSLVIVSVLLGKRIFEKH